MASTDEAAPHARPAPASVTGKRKRGGAASLDPFPTLGKRSFVTIQVITGSYERVLHGITSIIPLDDGSPATFSNNFLFNAHSSSIRCIAISPPSDVGAQQNSKRILATGSSDERINLYQISCVAPSVHANSTAVSLDLSSLPLLTTNSVGNRELGALLHHNSAISALQFPSRSKLLSAANDNNITITRVRDWTVLSTIHAPIPKPAGRPSGDTAGAGDAPVGINAVAIHPSAKLCLSVGQGERCMRLWNLVTGKKAGVLTFDKGILTLLGEGRWRGGEGRQVVWSRDGEEFAVGFERGAVVYGLDCTVRGLVKLRGTKLCQIKYLPADTSSAAGNERSNVLMLATEDGRVLFYDTNPAGCPSADFGPAGSASKPKHNEAPSVALKLLAMLGPTALGARIKDFEVLALDPSDPEAGRPRKDIELKDRKSLSPTYAIITGGSDGAVHVWRVKASEIFYAVPTSHEEPTALRESSSPTSQKQKAALLIEGENGKSTVGKASEEVDTPRQVGALLGTFETRRRITCLASFVMEDPPASTAAQDIELGSTSPLNANQHNGAGSGARRDSSVDSDND